jgi:TadE-like protein
MRALRHRRAARRERECGAVAVEFALIFPLLAMLLMGTITGGYAYSKGISLTNAVREGSRFGATAPYPSVTGDWAADVIERTRALQFDDSSDTQVCVALYKDGVGDLVNTCDGPTISPAPTPPATPSGLEPGECVVKVWASRTYDIVAILVNFTDKVMTRQSIALYERTPCGSP